MKITAHYEQQVQEYALSMLDPNYTWVYFGHDYQIGDYWSEDDINRNGKTRWFPRTHGDPETVKTWYKEDRVSLSPAWQDFAKLMFVCAAFGKADASLYKYVQAAFERTMEPTVVITNKQGFPDGYMPLCMGGNVARLVNDRMYRFDNQFGLCYKIETLNASEPPPDVEDVFYNKPWLWSKATNARYAYPHDNIDITDPYQHVIPFPKMDEWNAHVPLLNISNYGFNYVQVARCFKIQDGIIPEVYNPPLIKAWV